MEGATLTCCRKGHLSSWLYTKIQPCSTMVC